MAKILAGSELQNAHQGEKLVGWILFETTISPWGDFSEEQLSRYFTKDNQ